MLRKIQYTVITALIILAASCGNSKMADEKSFVLKGKLNNTKGESLYLYELGIRDNILLDSVKIDEEGAFLFHRDLDSTRFFILRSQGNNFTTFIISPGENLILEGNVEDLMHQSRISGSAESESLSEFESIYHSYNLKTDSLGVVLMQTQHLPEFATIKDSLDSLFMIIRYEYKLETQKFIKEKPSSLSCLIALNRKFRNTEIFNDMEDAHLFFEVEKAILQKYPGNKHSLDHKQRMDKIREIKKAEKEAMKRLQSGLPAPELKLEDIAGNEVSLSLLKGKYTAVCFWASWSAESRLLNRQLAEIYPAYKIRGFDVYGISLDEEKEIWEAAYRMDKLPWTQVWAPKSWDAQAVKLYYVKELPQITLIDPEGIIIKHNLDLESLQTELDSIFQQ